MSSLSTGFLFAALLAAGSVAVTNSAAQSTATLDIAPAKRISFTPPAGTAWNLDGSLDGQTWNTLAGPFFANGSPAEYLSLPGTASKFRLTAVNPAVGFAPLTLAGCSAVMERSGQPVEVVFMSGTRGFLRIDDWHARGFTYTWHKTSANSGEAILSGLDGTFTLLRFKFLDAGLGGWGMEDIPSPQAASLVKVPLDAGAFSFRTGRFRRGVDKAELPMDFSGGSLVLNEGNSLSHVRFTGEDTVEVTTADGVVRSGNYAYDPASATKGSLFLNLTAAPPFGLDLGLTGSGTGKYKEILSPGAPSGAAPRNGTFTLPEKQLPPDNPDCPPPGLGGRSYVINDSAPCTLVFYGDGTGAQMRDMNGAVQVTYFNYSYSRTGRNSASVSITFPGAGSDLIEDYQLDFSDDCTGAFRRDSYANGNTAGTTGGTFGPGGLAGRAVGGLGGLGP
ncbi:MAG TPA: hypothetical protein VHM91_25360 [Verrucomicrobiales bacterium]|nr:hypothetical protein [Verrucomicrobiales bacterium]